MRAYPFANQRKAAQWLCSTHFRSPSKVAGRRIVVVGGGLEALNKTRLALKTSAEVSVWARGFDRGFDDLQLGARLTLNRREAGLASASVGQSNWLDRMLR